MVGGHATVGRLSNNVFGRFKQLGRNFLKKSLNGHATVVGGHATVGRLSNNVFGRFKHLRNFLKKVTERSRDSGRRSRDRRSTVGHHWCCCYLTGWILHQHMLATKLPNPLNITVATVCIRIMNKLSTIRTVTQPSPDCQALSVLLYYVNSLVNGAVMYLV